MDFEVDHVFISVSPGAPEIGRLLASGFDEGPSNAHPGQGTACRRIFFRNCYLEFVWLDDEAEASSPLVRRMGITARTGMTGGASRLGIGLRPAHPSASPAPVSTWAYRARYLPKGESIPVAANSEVVREPLLFFLPARHAQSGPDPLHPNGARAVTNIHATLGRSYQPSPELEWLGTAGPVRWDFGGGELLTVELDRGQQGKEISLEPSTPLLLKW